jgi:hypothetical protein
MLITIKNWSSGAVLYSCEAGSLSGTNLSGTNLSEANLSWADLSGTNLSGTNLSEADLSWADLSGANLFRANLSGANLSWADLSGTNLSEADLYWAELSGATNIPDSARLLTTIVPEDGPFFGWKKCRGEKGVGAVLVKVAIGSNARRSNATGRKCRAEYVKVLEVIGGEVGFSSYDDGKTEYRKGQVVRCDHWEENRWIECGGGIHFFLTRAEAEKY